MYHVYSGYKHHFNGVKTLDTKVHIFSLFGNDDDTSVDLSLGIINHVNMVWLNGAFFIGRLITVTSEAIWEGIH